LFEFKNSLAYRIFKLAIKVEKLSIDTKKIKDMEKLKKMASLQTLIENGVDSVFFSIDETEKEMKKNIKEKYNTGEDKYAE